MQNSRILVWLSYCVMLVIPGLSGADDKQPDDRVSFQVEVGRDVENDRVTAVMNLTAEKRKPEELADVINTAMTWALEQAQANDKIKVRSGTYQTYPVYDDKKIVRWRGRQELQLESRDVDQMSQLIGVLQNRLQMQSLQFSVSVEKRQQVEDQLIGEALAAWQARAATIHKALGATGYSLLDVNIHTGSQDRIVPMRMRAAPVLKESSVADPAMEQGTSRVTVQVSGSIRLLRD